MILALIFILRDYPNNLTSKKNVIMIFVFALIAGFGIACKVTFIPLAVIPFIILPKLKSKILYLITAMIAFVIFTLPIIRMYPQFFEWVFNLLTHSGRYGSGSSKFISTQKFINNINYLLLGSPFFSIILILALIILVITLIVPKLRKIHCSNIYFKLLAGLTAAQVMGLLMVSKHSANHYLLPVLNLSGFALFLIFIYFKNLWKYLNVNPKILQVAAAFFLVFLFVLVNPVGNLNRRITRLEILKNRSLAIYYDVENNYQDYVKIFYYGSSSPAYALKFGNDLSRSYHSELLEKEYKNVYFYDIWKKHFTGFDYNRTIPFKNIKKKYGNKIIFQGPNGLHDIGRL
jgi:hypothetical protein